MFMILLPVQKKEILSILMYCSLPEEKRKMLLNMPGLFLEKIGESAEALDSCKFCHSEKADVEVEKQIKSDGHHIVPLDGCPDN
ncbi:MAG: hypothetical protein CM1200mP30_01100 [Pseudomonadota bacterium]|nr:MAG: hypothetical protein CM1200mP30_01100 [Pseudomonadota bacterium]